MPSAFKLTISATRTNKPGRYGDGRGLYLIVSGTGMGKYVLRFTAPDGGKVTEMGLGSRDVVSIGQARDAAQVARELVAAGINPITARKANRQIQPICPAFGEVAGELIAAKQPGWRSAIHAAQWSATLKDYCASIWNKQVDEIAVADVLRVLTGVWSRIPATGSRLRGRIEAVLDYAKAKGWRSGENPAMWRGGLEHLLPRRQRLAKPHHAAMPYPDVPGFIATLRERRDVPHLAIEFLILTAARSGEARCAQWAEINSERATWTLPPARMKAGIAHTVPLSPRAAEILREVRDLHGSLVFPGKHERPVASTVLHKILPPGVTLHGFESSFADWAAERTHSPREVCEQALAHTVGNATELAYRRTNLLERRRELMSAWAQFCEPVAATNVVSIAAGR